MSSIQSKTIKLTFPTDKNIPMRSDDEMRSDSGGLAWLGLAGQYTSHRSPIVSLLCTHCTVHIRFVDKSNESDLSTNTSPVDMQR